MSGDEPATPRGLRRILLWGGLYSIAVVSIVAGLLVLLGDRVVLPWLLAKATGARVEMEIDGLFSGVSIPYLALYEPDTPFGAPPAIAIEDFTADYRFRARGGRYIEGLNIGQLSLMLDGRNPGQPNYRFLQQFINAPSSGRSPLPFLPRRVQLGQAKLSLDFPQWRFHLDGLELSAELPSLGVFSFTMLGEPLTFGWSMPELGLDQPNTLGGLQARVQRSGPMLGASFKAGLPGLADVDAAVAAVLSADSHALSISINTAEFREALWGNMLAAWTPLPLRFDVLRVQDTTLNAHYSEQRINLSDTHLDAMLEGLILGDLETPLYKGNLRLSGEGGFDPGKPFSAIAHLNQGQELAMVFRREDREFIVDLAMEKWSREDLDAITPAAYRDYLGLLPGLRGLGAAAHLTWSDPGYTLQLSAKPVLPGNAATTVDIDGGGILDMTAETLFDGRLMAQGRGGRMECVVHLGPAGALSAQAQLHHFQPGVWWTEWSGSPAFGAIMGSLDGSLSFKYLPDAVPSLSADLTAADPSVLGFALAEDSPINIDAEISLDGDVLRAHRLVLAAPDRFRMESAGLEIGLAAHALRGRILAEYDLAYLGGLAGFDDLWGDAVLNAGVDMKMDHPLRADLTITSDSLGYGDWALPYGETLEMKIPLQVNPKFDRFEADSIDATLGENTRIAIRRPVAQTGSPDGLSMAAESIRLDSDFAPLVAMGWLDAAEGRLQAEIDSPAYTAAGTQGRLSMNAAAELLSVYGGMAVFHELQAEGSASNPRAPAATVMLRTGELLTGGAMIRNLEANLRIEKGKCYIETNEAEIFGGIVQVQVEADLQDEALPVRVQGLLKNIDLHRFTTEFEPPAVKMTGIASGNFDIRFDRHGIRDLSAELACPGPFTINRDVVYQLAKYTQGVAILGKSLENAIGKADPRPFESAELSISWQGGDATISTYVRSRLLDLAPVFYVRADWARLLQMLRENQLQELKNLDYSLD